VVVDLTTYRLTEDERRAFIASGDYVARRLRREDLVGYPGAWTQQQCRTFEFFMADLARQSTLYNCVMLHYVPGGDT